MTTHRPTKPPKKPTAEEPTTESSAVEEIQSTSEATAQTSQKPKPSKPIVKPPPHQPEVTDGCPCENENEVETTTAKKPTTSRRPATTTRPTTTTSQGEEAEEEVVAEEGDLDTASSQDVDCTSDGFKSHQMCNKVGRRRGYRIQHYITSLLFEKKTYFRFRAYFVAIEDGYGLLILYS